MKAEDLMRLGQGIIAKNHQKLSIQVTEIIFITSGTESLLLEKMQDCNLLKIALDF